MKSELLKRILTPPRIILSSLLVFLLVTSYAPDSNNSDTVYFEQGDTEVSVEQLEKDAELQSLILRVDSLLQDTTIQVTKILLQGYSSPEGDVRHNKELSLIRIKGISDYMVNQKGLPLELIELKNHGSAWSLLRDEVQASNLDAKQEIISIIDNVPEETWARVNPTDRYKTLVDSRNKHLMDLQGGKPYKYLFNNIYPKLRNASVVTVYFHKIDEEDADQSISEVTGIHKEEQTKSEIEPETAQTPSIEVEIEPQQEIIAELQPIVIDSLPLAQELVVVQPETEPEQQPEPEPEPEPQPEPKSEKKSQIAIKSNLAMLAVGVTNIGVEIGFCDRYSLDVPLIYSPYTLKSNYKLRLLAIQPEFRYWLTESFQGHFVGIHTHLAYFNVAVDSTNRYQNSAESPLWGFGISYGYNLKIIDNLNVEFTLGVGYAAFDYDVFYNLDNGAQYNSGSKGYWGITKAGVSLMYMFNY